MRRIDKSTTAKNTEATKVFNLSVSNFPPLAALVEIPRHARNDMEYPAPWGGVLYFRALRGLTAAHAAA